MGSIPTLVIVCLCLSVDVILQPGLVLNVRELVVKLNQP